MSFVCMPRPPHTLTGSRKRSSFGALTDGPWIAMGDTKWGFGTNYAHRTLPFKWHHAGLVYGKKHGHCCLLFHASGLHANSHSGYSYYDQNSSLQKTFRPTSMPAYRDDFLPLDTNYKEREQNNRWAMSCNSAW